MADLVSPSDHRVFAGVELGGTKGIALVWREGAIVDRYKVPTTDPDQTLDQLGRWLAKHPLRNAFAGLGIASFGPVRLDPACGDHGRILATTKPGWSGAAVLASLAGRVGCPAAIDTDVNAAAIAEHRWGAGQGCSSLVYLTVGTGVGGGIAIDGRAVHGALHPELGHLRLRRAAGDGFAGVCSFHGDCIEGLICGPAIAARFGGSVHDAAPDDPRRGFLAADLAELLAALILMLAPQRILVGGGAGLGVPGLLDGAIARLPAILAGYLPELDLSALRMMIGPPALGADAGPLGAIALAIDAADPEPACAA
ncbi:ROK family protein [Novosphingobium sp. Gsoil 351]|uniref:ROK family protein n=1 Tax=Novosphingobium sp. Gsoil 351 TaxID=2675225 RepID=UPI0012B4BB42|nr:ROK family protein [Novosphingobium sp. Gsoil 351]QGN54424.1 ROK family protein [Novosphingobium sp. Gsoil 351]